MAKTKTPKDRNKLSQRQRDILDFIEDFIGENGYPPTIRDIGAAVEIPSTSVVNYNLNKLVREGYLERSKKVSRGLMLIKDEHQEPKETSVRSANEVFEVPMVGQIVASRPLEFFEYHDDETVEIPPTLLNKVPQDQVYALRVKGHSMIDAMVDDGDIVILQRQETAQDRDMVAVWLEDSGATTLKYFFHAGEKIRLQPANPTMDPIFVDPKYVKIQGRVLAVMRTL